MITVPPIIPASAPALVIPRQKSDRINTGPNAAPRPAQANSTSQNTSLTAGQSEIDRDTHQNQNNHPADNGQMSLRDLLATSHHLLVDVPDQPGGGDQELGIRRRRSEKGINVRRQTGEVKKSREK